MTRYFLMLVLLLLSSFDSSLDAATSKPVAAVAVSKTPVTTFVAAAYKLGIGDEISVSVFGEPELSRSFVVNDSGAIMYPLIGEIKVMAQKTAEVENLIVARLKAGYLINPKVSVSVSKYRPFYVSGQVKIAGAYPFEPGLTVRQAVSKAGGLTERASQRKMFIVPEGKNGKKNGRKVTMDDAILPGDTLTVEESFF
jgi:polysaccharide biosynthesis/export protein VpsN